MDLITTNILKRKPFITHRYLTIFNTVTPAVFIGLSVYMEVFLLLIPRFVFDINWIGQHPYHISNGVPKVNKRS